jgi:hypothetical protein
MTTNLDNCKQTTKPPPSTMVYNMPIHRKDLGFMDLKKIPYTVTKQPCLLLDVVIIAIEIKDGNDLADLLQVGKLISTDSWNKSLNEYKLRAV